MNFCYRSPKSYVVLAGHIVFGVLHIGTNVSDNVTSQIPPICTNVSWKRTLFRRDRLVFIKIETTCYQSLFSTPSVGISPPPFPPLRLVPLCSYDRPRVWLCSPQGKISRHFRFKFCVCICVCGDVVVVGYPRAVKVAHLGQYFRGNSSEPLFCINCIRQFYFGYILYISSSYRIFILILLFLDWSSD